MTMKTWERPLLLAAATAMAAMALLSACKKDDDPAPEDRFDRTALLSDVAHRVIVPAYDALALSADSLRDAAQAFAAAPDDAALQALRTRWNAARERWAACEMFRFAFQYEQSINDQIASWPINATVIEGEIGGSGPIDEAYITSTGTTRKGFSAVEYLLYTAPDDPAAVVAAFTTGAHADRRATYLVSLCTHIAARTRALAQAWDTDGQNYASTFISNTQSDISGSLNLLVNAWVEHIEYTRRMKVEIPHGIENGGTPLPDAVEDRRSHRSLANIRAGIRQWKAILSCGDGTGIDDNLDAVDARYEGSALSGRIRAQLDACTAACDAITVPLDEAVLSQPEAVDALYLAIKRLTVLTKLDMASSLGVIITFSDNDGD
ncbi:MAG: imelysin family protein [Bacteroidetes bacterium]|nr:imelysin family protein [Bacteroidota bacterium]